MTKAFESDVKVGELRIFADLERPVVALIAEDRGAFGFRIIPVSDFTNVSCEGEQRFGDRVYQFWNACSVPRCFAARSWVVDTLSSADLQSLLSTSTSTSNFLHPLTSYQRAYLFSVPSPLVRLEKESSLRSSSFLISHSVALPAGRLRPVSSSRLSLRCVSISTVRLVGRRRRTPGRW